MRLSPDPLQPSRVVIRTPTSDRFTLFLLALALGLRSYLIWDAATRGTFIAVVPDDSFYYFRIAENLLAGLGSTFDGLAPTNGYHPLWLLLILPVFALPLEPAPAVWLVMGLGALLWCLGAIPLARIASGIMGSARSALPLVVLYLFGPGTIYFSLNGLETSLCVLLHLLLLSWVAGRWEETGPLRPMFYLGYGVLAGLLFLSRTDSAILLLVLTPVLAAGGLRLPQAGRLGGFLLAGAVAGLISLPWMLWNQLTFGELVQSSGKALPFLAWTWAREVEHLSNVDLFLRSVGHLAAAPADLFRWAGLPIGNRTSLVAFLVISALFVPLRSRLAAHPLRWAIFAVVSSQFLYILVHTAIRWSPRDWYYAFPVVVLYATLAAVLHRWTGRAALFAAVTIVSWMLVVQSEQWFEGAPYTSQLPAWEVALNHHSVLPVEERIGSTDAGITGYLMEGRTVVNLDGLVNSEVLDYYRRGDGIQYLRDRNIQHVYLREPVLDPVFMGPAGLFLDGPAPFGRWQVYHLIDDLGRLVQRSFPIANAAFGDPEINRYLGPGWTRVHQPAPLRWTIGKRAVIYLPLPDAATHQLTLEAKKFRPIEAQTMTLKLNSQPLGEHAISDNWTRFSISLPAQITHSGVNVLEIEPGTTLRPSDVSESEDKRPLGIAVRTIDLR